MQLPGLAHFCEHMLFFLDRTKYPRDDELQAYLAEHGGSANAFTADTHTNYYFNVRDEALEGALERSAAKPLTRHQQQPCEPLPGSSDLSWFTRQSAPSLQCCQLIVR